jgi:TolB-like protein/Tfp pilus assembly protein PilF
MALVFRRSSEEPVRCALEIARALKTHPEIKVRMGIHSGPVSDLTDVSGRTNIAGGGINMAQRVMDSGDAGHILLSQRVAGDLEQYREWQPLLHDVGECEAKHGVRLHLFNLYTDDAGNAAVPEKLRKKDTPPHPIAIPGSTRRRPRSLIIAAALILFFALGATLFFVLRKPTLPNGTIPDKSVAVLPLVNTGGDPKNEYFSDGLSEELIAVLAKIPGLKVIGRSSSFLFKGKPDSSAAIGEKLGVAQLIEGSVRRDGDRVRIVAGLIKATDGRELWSETYDRNLKDVFAVQSEIAQAVASQLKVKLLGEKPASDAAPSSQNPAAHDALLQARFYFDQANEASSLQAIHYAEEATRLDPGYASAWAFLSRAQRFWGASFATRDGEKAFADARKSAEKAIQLEPNSVDALVALSGVTLNADFDFQAAERYASRALQLAPGDVVAKRTLTDSLMAQGRLDEADVVAKELTSADPLQFATWYNRGLIAVGRGRYSEAKEIFRKTLEVQPSAARVHAQFVALDLQQNNLQAALDDARAEAEGFWRDFAVALALQAGDDRAAADSALRGLLEKYGKVGGFQIAQLYAVRKDPDSMFQWLDTSYANRDGGLTTLFVTLFIRDYRDDPRFAAFCQKLKIHLPRKQ